jgi:membrane protein involved in colicin uptake
VGKTDFWERAERTRNAAIETRKRAEEVVREREEREAEEKTKAERIKRYEAATVLEFEIIQVVKDGCLARVLNDNQKRIFSN